MNQLKINEPVKHNSKSIYDAKVFTYSKSGKRVGVLHNHLYPWGVGMIVSWYDPSNIVSRLVK